MDITWRIVFSAFTAALAGFLFGFDTVVISGAEQKIQSLWSLSPAMHGIAMGSALYGIVIAYVSNSLLAGVGENAWRWMMGVAAFPSLLYAMLCLRIAESPRWLLDRTHHRETAAAALRFIYPRCSQRQLEGMLQNMSNPEPAAAMTRRFWTRSLQAPILLAFMVALFNQLSGINAILYFAPRIFRLTGLSQQAALLQSVGIGVTNLVFTFIGLWLIDRVGRRTLLFIGSLGYIFSLGMVSWAFFTVHFSWIPACIFIFIAAHAVGQGAVIWVLISEIFPTQYRAQGQTLGSFTHWAMAALVTSIFPSLVTWFAPGYVFGFFCAMMILQLIWVQTMVVETKGLPLEAVTERLKSVWYSGASPGAVPASRRRQ